jgi:hypothetical protein
VSALLWGDDDPEDAWDASDPVDAKLDVLDLWLPSIDAEMDTPSTGRASFRLDQALEAVDDLSRDPSLTPFHKNRLYKMALYLIFLVIKRG